EGCEEAIQTAMSAQNQAEREMATVTAQLQAADKETQENEQNCTERQQELKKQQEAVTRDAQSLAGELETALQVTWTDHLALPQELEQRIRKFQEAQATANQLAEKQQVFQTAKASYEGRREPLEKAVNVAQTKVNDLNAELGQLRQTRQEKFGGAQVDEEEESLAKKVQAAHQASENANGELSVAKTNLANNQENQKNLNDRLQALASPLAETATAVSDKLLAFGFADVAEFEAKRREATRVQELTEKLQQLSGVMTQAKTALDERKATLAEWQQKLPADASREANLKQLTALQEEKTAVQSTLNDLGARLQGDDLNREKREKLVAEHRQLEVQHNDWTFLNDKFGSKKDLNRFGRLAQGYTFRRLLFFANNLNFPALNNHFTLETDAIDPLELNVRDHFRGNQVRTSKNLSGGESFEVSLALALGLAEMSASSQNARLGNVLIDEGFGSLDSKSLDGALDMLTQLNTTGNKLVGIISHVERLQECIPAQIQVVNSNGMGKLVGAGVGSLSDARQWSKANPIPKRDK
ncbi:MAG: hypothetical protein J6866_07495, partial [Victivallales bacterium]|nr:hypothetical protein [Victivallales bacterium]